MTYDQLKKAIKNKSISPTEVFKHIASLHQSNPHLSSKLDKLIGEFLGMEDKSEDTLPLSEVKDDLDD